MTHLIASACILLLLFTGVAHYSRRSRLPAEAWMLMIGLGLGLLSKYTPLKLIPANLFSPGLILVGILPLLIFASGRKIRPAILKKDIPEITYLDLYRTLGAFVWAVLAALPAGLLLGWLGAWLLRVWHEHQIFFTTSMSLILTLPESFPYKGEFQCLAFVAIAAGLILQPLLVQGVLDRSDVSPVADAGEPQQGKR